MKAATAVSGTFTLSLSLLTAGSLCTSLAFLSSTSCSHKTCTLGRISPARNSGALFSSSKQNVDNASPNNDQKPLKSRLAQLAEDWLEEEEEEDELLSYWDRFDTNRASSSGETNSLVQNTATTTATEEEDDSLTTEERLERYFDSRGINKALEAQHATDIEAAIGQAQRAETPVEAIHALSKVQPWLQPNTRLGGKALYELAVALWQEEVLERLTSASGQDEDTTLLLFPQGDSARILETLMNNPHMKDQVRQLLKQRRPPIRNKTKSNIFGAWGDAFSSPQNWWT